MKNLHVPLPEEVHSSLKAHSALSKRPATALAREAIEAWLRAERKRIRHEEITAFAVANAGSELDLDPLLEQSAIEHLLSQPLDREPRKKGKRP